MKLSTRGRYGIHAMYDLAMHADEGPQSIKAISARQEMPEAYLEQIIAVLKVAGLVTSVRGAQGGYKLSRPPEQISVGDMLRALEGGLNLMECVEVDECCSRSKACASRMMWMKIRDGFNAVVDSITLRDMIEDNDSRMAEEE